MVTLHNQIYLHDIDIILLNAQKIIILFLFQYLNIFHCKLINLPIYSYFQFWFELYNSEINIQHYFGINQHSACYYIYYIVVNCNARKSLGKSKIKIWHFSNFHL